MTKKKYIKLLSPFLSIMLSFLMAFPLPLWAQGLIPDVRTPLTNVTPPRSFTAEDRPMVPPELIQQQMGLNTGVNQYGSPGMFYNVHIVGEVLKPGSYKILPSERLSDALNYAGGVKDLGSQRFIQLRRKGTTKIVDIFAYKTKGYLSENPYLMENDVVYVPLKKGEFQIEGPVGRPGLYEISRSLTLKSAVEMAGGFSTARSTKEPIRIIRFSENEEKEVVEVVNDTTSINQAIVKKGDVVVVPHVLTANTKFDYSIRRVPGDNIFYPTLSNHVYVIGSVVKPGPYPFTPGFSYLDYASQAGVADGNLKRAKLLKADGKRKRVKSDTQINPGDTIVVPPRALTATNTVYWLSTLASLALSGIYLSDRFKD